MGRCEGNRRCFNGASVSGWSAYSGAAATTGSSSIITFSNEELKYFLAASLFNGSMSDTVLRPASELRFFAFIKEFFLPKEDDLLPPMLEDLLPTVDDFLLLMVEALR